MNENHEAERTEPEIERQMINEQEQDDNYPGSFFRIPGTPVPGQTEWSML